VWKAERGEGSYGIDSLILCDNTCSKPGEVMEKQKKNRAMELSQREAENGDF